MTGNHRYSTSNFLPFDALYTPRPSSHASRTLRNRAGQVTLKTGSRPVPMEQDINTSLNSLSVLFSNSAMTSCSEFNRNPILLLFPTVRSKNLPPHFTRSVLSYSGPAAYTPHIPSPRRWTTTTKTHAQTLS